MMTFRGKSYAIAVTAALFCVLVVSSHAQGVRRPSRTGAPAAGEAGNAMDLVRIRKISGLGNRAVVSTPYYDTSYGAGVKPVREWGMMRVDYDSYPEWIDELTFRYTVITVTVVEGKRAYSLYRSAVRYMDIERGRNHTSIMLLRPSALKRYGAVVAVAVEIMHEGKVVAVESDQESKLNFPVQWWNNPQVTENPSVTVRSGYLLDRSKTPFALVNYDDYEAIK
jgi:hypothetical protein